MEGKSGAEATAAATVRQAMADPAQVVKYLHIRATVLEAKGHDNGPGHRPRRNEPHRLRPAGPTPR